MLKGPGLRQVGLLFILLNTKDKNQGLSFLNRPANPKWRKICRLMKKKKKKTRGFYWK